VVWIEKKHRWRCLWLIDPVEFYRQIVPNGNESKQSISTFLISAGLKKESDRLTARNWIGGSRKNFHASICWEEGQRKNCLG